MERADACRVCNGFCLCLDAAQSVETYSPDVALLSMLPLELLARREGFHPLAPQMWSATH